jgi:hypothetical protein
MELAVTISAVTIPTPISLTPLNLRSALHDRLPKAKLDNGYLGDTYPLCDDIPAQAFLRQGARYEFTGEFSAEGFEMDSGMMGGRTRFSPTPGASALHQALCAPSAEKGGACTFPLVVTLPNNLPCYGQKECNGQRVLTVQINDTVAQVTRYYSYLLPPCVRLALFPTTPFEALWNALGEWVGVTPEAMNDLLPNLGNFQANQLFKKEDLFEA